MMIALLALLGLAVGGTAEIYLHKQLYDRVDEQLDEAGKRVNMHPGDRGGGGSSGYFLGNVPPGAQPGSVFLFLQAAGSQVVAGGGQVQVPATATTDESPFQPRFEYADLTDQAIRALAAVPVGQNRDVDLGSLGSYRATAETMTGGTVFITALPLAATEATLIKVAVFTGIAVLVAVVIAGWTGAIVIRRTLQPLDRVAATATRVAELELDRGEVELAQRVPERDTDPRTEVGQVGGALNRLLDHVGNALEARHASEMQVRQFVADASHELRTPLAAIRGYAELSRRSRAPVPEEIAHVLNRVESEAKRMTVLVEDLLLLARLDAGRPLAHDPVDLTMLVVDAVSDAHATGPRHLWQLDLPEEPVTVVGDGARLHQVLANLLANARTHTPEGTTVTVGVGVHDDRAVLRVTDSGPGIPAELQPHIFERFARGDSSRSRAAGSTGLGLSIVHAVVSSHGGQVAVESRPGRTVFTVLLPLVPPTAVPAAEQFARITARPR
jgi:two-component system, OmpR family, sensor kinase